MSLAQIIYPPPTPRGFQEWAFQHYAHHLAIISAANAQGIPLREYNIWPIEEKDIGSWLQRHQQMHNEMNAMAGVSGNDLEDVDFKDKKKVDAWYYLQFVEHQSVAAFLGNGV